MFRVFRATVKMAYGKHDELYTYSEDEKKLSDDDIKKEIVRMVEEWFGWSNQYRGCVVNRVVSKRVINSEKKKYVEKLEYQRKEIDRELKLLRK